MPSAAWTSEHLTVPRGRGLLELPLDDSGSRRLRSASLTKGIDVRYDVYIADEDRDPVSLEAGSVAVVASDSSDPVYMFYESDVPRGEYVVASFPVRTVAYVMRHVHH